MDVMERIVLAAARRIFKNNTLKIEDIMEWSTGDVKSVDGEVSIRVDELSVNIAIKSELDKREKSNGNKTE